MILVVAIAASLLSRRADHARRLRAFPCQMARFERELESSLAKASNDTERRSISDRYRSRKRVLIEEAIDLSLIRPRDPASFEVLALIATSADDIPDLRDRALDATIRTQIRNPAIVALCAQLARLGRTFEPADDLLRRAIRDNPTREVRGRALLSLGQRKLEHARVLRFIRQNPAAEKKLASSIGGGIQYILKPDPDDLEQEAENLFEQVINGYQDVLDYQKIARKAIFELTRLSVGKPAPEIEGRDSYGRTISLSSFRGKLVVVIFSGLT
jgi:hypothetical protein